MRQLPEAYQARAENHCLADRRSAQLDGRAAPLTGTVMRSLDHCQAIRRGSLMAPRSKHARQRHRLVVQALVRVGRDDLLYPSFHRTELLRVLEDFARGAPDAITAEEREAISFTHSTDARALHMFIVRNPAWLRALLPK